MNAAKPNVTPKTSTKPTMKRIAIIGSGISGLSAAYYLHQHYDVSVYEQADYLGGHTDTHTVEIEGKRVNVDSGFIIFCPEYYPHFSAMLDELGVASQPTDMSFSAFNQNTDTVYNATNLNKLFCDRKNLFKPKFWRMLWDIARFYRKAPIDVAKHYDATQTIGEYLNDNNYSSNFEHDHLLPMISALWSATPARVKAFPIKHLVDFFQAHGLMKILGRPQWRVVKGGSFNYVKALRKQLNVNWLVGIGAQQIVRDNGRVEIIDSLGQKTQFDAVIMACHADTGLRLLGRNASAQETAILGAMPFEKNQVIVHTDESVMHKNKLSWASWNTEVPNENNPNSLNCCTANYWMNSLQNLDIKTNVFTSLNSSHKIQENTILARRQYSHPVFTPDSVAAQKRLHEINGKQNTFFVGAYWGWGFHEDGARTAYHTCRVLIEQLTRTESESTEHNHTS